MNGNIKEKLTRAIYQDGVHEFLITVDFSKLDAALFVKAIRSAQSRATLGHGAVVILHQGKIAPVKKVAAP